MKVEAAIELVLQLLNAASVVGQRISAARAEGRDLTSEELQAVVDADSQARARLVEQIEIAKAEGR